jgi:hypothetical protein
MGFSRNKDPAFFFLFVCFSRPCPACQSTHPLHVPLLLTAVVRHQPAVPRQAATAVGLGVAVRLGVGIVEVARCADVASAVYPVAVGWQACSIMDTPCQPQSQQWQKHGMVAPPQENNGHNHSQAQRLFANRVRFRQGSLHAWLVAGQRKLRGRQRQVWDVLAALCGALWCSVVLCGAPWCSVVLCGALWCSAGALWCTVHCTPVHRQWRTRVHDGAQWRTVAHSGAQWCATQCYTEGSMMPCGMAY